MTFLSTWVIWVQDNLFALDFVFEHAFYEARRKMKDAGLGGILLHHRYLPNTASLTYFLDSYLILTAAQQRYHAGLHLAIYTCHRLQLSAESILSLPEKCRLLLNSLDATTFFPGECSPEKKSCRATQMAEESYFGSRKKNKKKGFELRVDIKPGLTRKSEILSNGPLCCFVLSSAQTADFVDSFGSGFVVSLSLSFSLTSFLLALWLPVCYAFVGFVFCYFFCLWATTLAHSRPD